MDFTIKDLLNVPSLKDAVLLSEHNSLNRIISGATIMEAPDITDWIKGGELLLTSLYPILNFTEEEQTQFISRLAEREIGALVIKIDRFVSEIPEPIIAAAKKYGVPLIQIPRHVLYIDVMYPVMGELFNNQVKKLQYYKEIHDRFTALSLADEGADKIINTLEKLIGNPVSLFDRNFQCIGSTVPSLAEFEIIEKVPASFNQKNKIKFPHYRQAVEYSSLEGQKGWQIVVPIETMNHIKTYLLIDEYHKPLEELDFIAVENCAISLSLELVKQFAVAEVDKQLKNDFIDDLIGGKLRQMGTILQKANVIGWDLGGPFTAVVLKLTNYQETYSTKRKQKRVLSDEKLEMVYEAINHHVPNGIIRSRGNQIIILWKINRDAESQAASLAKMKEIIREIQQSIKVHIKEVGVQVGIGSIVKRIVDIPKSYREAQDALEFGEIINGKDAVTMFSELGIFRLLCKFDDDLSTLRNFIPASLQKLLEYPHANKRDLLMTLQTFLECNQHATKTSDRLFIHPKTVIYRLDRIKEITGMDFDNPEDMLSVQVGLKIVDLIERKTNQL
ncbi:PucR family transcriptional regulator [Neobacillus notoginsengisoli]|uniref:PucR family transcriptional regulator n=2 Tax=Neobacillus notoginsengisoli TaxID=1578198 RepID=A0A417YYP0_9BACI|nr:PucR family transcriptional regulator [Neobacillus notoginsengisoli]